MMCWLLLLLSSANVFLAADIYLASSSDKRAGTLVVRCSHVPQHELQGGQASV